MNSEEQITHTDIIIKEGMEEKKLYIEKDYF